MIPILFSGRGF
uniref:Uncharacterized protein n=1 Tax=Rhizophora mucronata TaxID=61149 RepID=A0A2P2NRN2_RHIMU